MAAGETPAVPGKSVRKSKGILKKGRQFSDCITTLTYFFTRGFLCYAPT
jgi:hypothetical protein